jgi:hypothetical protein
LEALQQLRHQMQINLNAIDQVSGAFVCFSTQTGVMDILFFLGTETYEIPCKLEMKVLLCGFLSLCY